MRRLSVALLSSAAGFAYALAAQPSYAQSNDGLRLEEITVTARKREESILSVPISVTAMTATALQNANVKDFQDVSKLTPSFYFSDQVAQLRADRATRVYVMRGLAIATVASGEAVLVFLDGAPVVGGGDIGTFANVDRVEILRGPQAAYFGRNTYAGAVNIVSKQPSDTFGGKIDLEYAKYDSKTAGLALEGPIVSDRLSARVTGRIEHKGGQYINLADGSDLGTRNTRQITSQLNFTPTDSLKVRAYFGYFKFDDGPDARGTFLIPERPCAVRGANRTWFCGALPDFPLSKIGFNTVVDQRLRDQVYPRSLFGAPLRDTYGSTTNSYQAHAIIDYDFADGMTFNTIGAWHDSRTSLISDEDARDTRGIPNSAANIARGGRPTVNEETNIDRYARDWSLEARLTSDQKNRFRFSGGASYVNGDANNSYVYGDSVTGIRAVPSSSGKTLVQTPAVFGGAYYDLTKQFTLSVEARYQWDKITSVPLVFVATPFSKTDGPALSNVFKSFSPRITIDYKPNEDTTIFALFSRGYRPGTFNSRFLTLTQSEIDQLKQIINAELFVRQEHLDNYELGIKSRLWDGRGQLGLSVYRGKIYDLQISAGAGIVDPRTGVANAITATGNLGQVEFHGVEAEFAFQATRELNLSASFSWNPTKFEKGVCPACTNIAGVDNIVGRSLPYAPQTKGSLSATYIAPLAGEFDWFVRPEFIYEGKKYSDQANFSWVRPRALLHLRAGVQSTSTKIEAYVTNLTDNKTAASAGPSTFDRLTILGTLSTTITSQLPERRTWGLRASYNF